MESISLANRNIMASLSGAGGSQIYRYDILNSGKWIRLLRLLPGRDDDTLSCELFSADIHSNSKYSAISYVWGDATKKAAIICSGHNFGITYNLRDALKRIRHETAESSVSNNLINYNYWPVIKLN
jgi:hypothetical protein